jgi:hypothetical protein
MQSYSYSSERPTFKFHLRRPRLPLCFYQPPLRRQSPPRWPTSTSLRDRVIAQPTTIHHSRTPLPSSRRHCVRRDGRITRNRNQTRRIRRRCRHTRIRHRHTKNSHIRHFHPNNHSPEKASLCPSSMQSSSTAHNRRLWILPEALLQQASHAGESCV